MQEKDPVCGMVVDSSTPYKSLYKGTVYYFCGLHCKRAFDENPKIYLERGPTGMPGMQFNEF